MLTVTPSLEMFNTSHVKAMAPRIRAKAQQLIAVLRGARTPSDEVEGAFPRQNGFTKTESS